MNTIPKIIHQTWKTNIIPKKMDFCINSWRKLNEDYEYKFWTDSDIQVFIIEKFPEYLEIFNKCKLGIQKADIFRLLVLYYYGGIYADIDFECLVPIKYWNIDKNKINIATEPIEHGKKDILCNALICSPKNQNDLLKILEHGDKILNANPNEVMNSFGPFAWTNILKDSKNINFIKSELFYPIPDITISVELEKKYRNIIINRNFGNSYAVHYWEHSNWPRTNILNIYYKYLTSQKK